MAIGNKYQLHILSRSQYDSLSKSSDYLYFVSEADGRINLYKGDVLVSNSFLIVSSLPSTGILGKLYLNTGDGLVYYYSGTVWMKVAKEVITSGLSSSSTNDTVPSSKLVWDTINNLISDAVSGTGGSVHPPVQSLSELAALTDAVDKMICLVEDTGELYRFDAEAEMTGAPGEVPGANGGVWIKVRGAIEVDSTYLTWSDGKLTLNGTWVNSLSKVTLTNTAAKALSSTASAGSSSEAARADHVHPTTGLALEEDVKWRTY